MVRLAASSKKYAFVPVGKTIYHDFLPACIFSQIQQNGGYFRPKMAVIFTKMVKILDKNGRHFGIFHFFQKSFHTFLDNNKICFINCSFCNFILFCFLAIRGRIGLLDLTPDDNNDNSS